MPALRCLLAFLLSICVSIRIISKHTYTQQISNSLPPAGPRPMRPITPACMPCRRYDRRVAQRRYRDGASDRVPHQQQLRIRRALPAAAAPAGVAIQQLWTPAASIVVASRRLWVLPARAIAQRIIVAAAARFVATSSKHQQRGGSSTAAALQQRLPSAKASAIAGGASPPAARQQPARQNQQP